ncbi:unnamed protein product [Ilex paraguariensis]|uniref:Uncharacterized protein n=1 Tax=Ilex paraguariensis TaxID=185542 RepID=A0ABC8USJ6_9AQUA
MPPKSSGFSSSSVLIEDHSFFSIAPLVATWLLGILPKADILEVGRLSISKKTSSLVVLEKANAKKEVAYLRPKLEEADKKCSGLESKVKINDNHIKVLQKEAAEGYAGYEDLRD